MRTCYLILPVLFLAACTRQPERPTIELSFADAIECASIPEARWCSNEDINRIVDSIENPEEIDTSAGVSVAPSFAFPAKWYAASPLGFLFRTTEVTCTGLLSGVPDTAEADAWYFGGFLVGLRFEAIWIDSGATWSFAEPFEPIEADDLDDAQSGLWRAVSLWETDYWPGHKRHLFRGDFDTPWIAAVDEYDADYRAQKTITVMLMRDVDYLDLLNPQLKSRLDTMMAYVTNGGHELRLERVDSGVATGQALRNRYSYDFVDRQYWAVLPPTLEFGGWIGDTIMGKTVPLVVVHGVVGETEIMYDFAHGGRWGVPFYVLSAEVISGTAPD